MENVTVTLPEDQVERVEKLAAKWSKRPPGVQILRAEALRTCIRVGLETLEAQVDSDPGQIPVDTADRVGKRATAK